jgi:excinuclease ABC subunit A
VITGLSGSGKSSLAFDTIYAEGQRRYVESLSAYARQFLEMMQKPDVDHIDGLSPAISIEQKTTSATRARPSARSPRSTTTCACCGRASACPIRPPPACRSRARRSARWSTGDGAARGHAALPARPVVRGRKGEYRKELADLAEEGLSSASRSTASSTRSRTRRRSTRSTSTTSTWWSTGSWCADIETRLADSFETALKLADGLGVARFADPPAAPTQRG